jgi:hypothetical protein
VPSADGYVTGNTHARLKKVRGANVKEEYVDDDDDARSSMCHRLLLQKRLLHYSFPFNLHSRLLPVPVYF